MRKAPFVSLTQLHQAAEDDNSDTDAFIAAKAETTKKSLEEKMKNWEATEEELRAATLGGVVPQKREDGGGRTDSFDVGLYVAFPFMIIGCLLFLAFPFLVNNIDVSTVGPPPTS